MHQLDPRSSPDRRVVSKFATPPRAGLSGLVPASLAPEMSHLPDLDANVAGFTPDQPALIPLSDGETAILIDDLAADALSAPHHAPPGFRSPRSRTDWSGTRAA